MKDKVKTLTADTRVRYLLAGGFAFASEYATFTFVQLFLNLFVANSISFIAGLLISFTLQRQWAFAGEHSMKKKKQFVGYIILACVNLLIANLIIGIMVGILNVEPLIAKIISMALVIVWNYLIMSRVLFRINKPSKSNVA